MDHQEECGRYDFSDSDVIDDNLFWEIRDGLLVLRMLFIKSLQEPVPVPKEDGGAQHRQVQLRTTNTNTTNTNTQLRFSVGHSGGALSLVGHSGQLTLAKPSEEVMWTLVFL